VAIQDPTTNVPYYSWKFKFVTTQLTPTQVLGANPNRIAVRVFNENATTQFIGPDNTVSGANGYVLLGNNNTGANALFSIMQGDFWIVNGLWSISSGTVVLSYIETIYRPPPEEEQ